MKFRLHRRMAGWWFTIVARNGRIIATSEVYDRRAGAMRAIEALTDAGLHIPLYEDP